MPNYTTILNILFLVVAVFTNQKNVFFVENRVCFQISMNYGDSDSDSESLMSMVAQFRRGHEVSQPLHSEPHVRSRTVVLHTSPEHKEKDI